MIVGSRNEANHKLRRQERTWHRVSFSEPMIGWCSSQLHQ